MSHIDQLKCRICCPDSVTLASPGFRFEPLHRLTKQHAAQMPPYSIPASVFTDLLRRWKQDDRYSQNTNHYQRCLPLKKAAVPWQYIQVRMGPGAMRILVTSTRVCVNRCH